MRGNKSIQTNGKYYFDVNSIAISVFHSFVLSVMTMMMVKRFKQV